MPTLGHAILIIAFVLCLYGAAASVYGVRTGRNDWVVSGRRSVYTLAALAIIAFALVESAFIRNDFHFRIVSSSSSTTIPLFYKLAAPWSSQQGSLLLWVTLLSIWSSVVLFLTRRRLREVAPYATAVLLSLAAFFDGLAIFFSNPFSQLPAAEVPNQGAGLDPLLMHPTMMIHPPMLYTGYTLMAIPFAFAIGALISGNLGSEWIRDTRKFALGAWLALGTGITLGMLWSYTELGWGGYWGWDAVENAALLPWLMMTAFIHSAQIQEKRGMLKVWNVSLVLLAGVLTIFGTFLVRSGVLDSIHAFGASTLGIPFIGLLAVMFVASIGLVLWRRESLKSEDSIDSLVSREAVFLFQNLIVCFIAFVIFFITIFPLLSEWITGNEQTVGPPAFAPFVVIPAIVLVLLTGVGPMISWRRATVANLRRNFVVPAAVGVAVLIVCLAWFHTGSKPLPTLMFGFGAFVIAGVLQEIFRGTRARHVLTGAAYPAALFGLVRRNRRRFGGYIVHAGFAVAMIGVAASSAFEHSRNVTLSPGQSAVVHGYRYTYVKPTEAVTPEHVSIGARIDISRNGKQVASVLSAVQMYPDTTDQSQDGLVRQFFDTSNANTVIGLKVGVLRNLWAAAQAIPTPRMEALLTDANKNVADLFNDVIAKTKGDSVAEQNRVLDDDPIVRVGGQEYSAQGFLTYAAKEIAQQYVTHPVGVQFLFIVAPMVMWLWAGAAIMFLGAVICLWPALGARSRQQALYRSRLARELA